MSFQTYCGLPGGSRYILPFAGSGKTTGIVAGGPLHQHQGLVLFPHNADDRLRADRLADDKDVTAARAPPTCFSAKRR
jgi:hypothetical protein